jgi:multidrug efflux pump subunit AcrB
VKIVEVPPGPPVPSVLVAEIYGRDDEERSRLARQVREVFERTPGVVDVDDSLQEDQVKYRFEIDRVKARLAGITAEEMARTLGAALEGETAGLAHLPHEKNPVPILVRLPREERSGIPELQELAFRNRETGAMVPLNELARVRETMEDLPIHHKNLRPVAYVTGDVSGKEESPVYGILNLSRNLSQLPDELRLEEFYASHPESEERPALKWDGEWQITYETFRDMGTAFAAALLLIYVLIVAQFQSFLIPLIIMAPIPLTLIGIVPGHWITGGYFTATSMIGFIALSGIIVRNSIILVDFIRKEEGAGTPLREAVIRSVAVRARPILLTAAALMVGSFVIILDPIFQGLAVSLLFGVLVSTLLTLLVIPLLYYSLLYNRSPAGEEPPA